MQTTPFLRRISALVLLTFTSLTLQPLQAVAQGKLEQAKLAQTKATQTASQGDDEQYAKLLDDIKETAKRGADKARKGQKTRDDTKTLRQQKKQLEALETKVDDAFAATETDLIAKRLPAEIINRHRAAVQDYKAKQSEFKRQAKTLEDADDQENESTRATSIDSLSTWLDQNQKGKPHTRTDPNKLPFRTPDGKVRAPIESEAWSPVARSAISRWNTSGYPPMWITSPAGERSTGTLIPGCRWMEVSSTSLPHPGHQGKSPHRNRSRLQGQHLGLQEENLQIFRNKPYVPSI